MMASSLLDVDFLDQNFLGDILEQLNRTVGTTDAF